MGDVFIFCVVFVVFLGVDFTFSKLVAFILCCFVSYSRNRYLYIFVCNCMYYGGDLEHIWNLLEKHKVEQEGV